MKWQETASWWSWEGKEGSSVEKVETESSRPIHGFVPLLDRVLVRFPPLAYGEKEDFFGGLSALRIHNLWLHEHNSSPHRSLELGKGEGGHLTGATAHQDLSR